jgi:hypothetical protein
MRGTMVIGRRKALRAMKFHSVIVSNTGRVQGAQLMMLLGTLSA